MYARLVPLRKGKLRLINALWSTAVGDKDTTRIATLKYGTVRLPCDLREDLQRQFYFLAHILSRNRTFRVGDVTPPTRRSFLTLERIWVSIALPRWQLALMQRCTRLRQRRK